VLPSLGITLGKSNQAQPATQSASPAGSGNSGPSGQATSWESGAGGGSDNHGGYGAVGGGSGVAVPTLPGPLPLRGPEKRRPMVPLSRLLGNRDFVITIECKADAVFVQPWGTRFPLASMPDRPDPNHPLVRTVEQIVARRQAVVAQGESPYRPLLHFQVHPDGLRAYYRAYPLLAGLQIPMARENLEK
jgi:hypothetical protein